MVVSYEDPWTRVGVIHPPALFRPVFAVDCELTDLGQRIVLRHLYSELSSKEVRDLVAGRRLQAFRH